ncbi:hypothetical protein [Rhizobium oryzicola]|uniref:Uncharacterized protein n=1 Tax=Rhizobium oryzicola TaxID=1232668 RepID=A0ABT8SWJ7_9HYPH|nr:hypothetical protein [Rhizobium oryzicola]MDO1582396.1 hypothetical protein [Rhizobium oryzicola]
MNLVEARAMVPDIIDAVEMAGDLTSSYDLKTREAVIYTSDPMTGEVFPVATIAADAPPDVQMLLRKSAIWLRALLMLREEAIRQLRKATTSQQQPQQRRTEPKKPQDHAQRASILCKQDRAFRRYLVECHGLPSSADENETRSLLRELMNITSFKELNQNPAAASRWEAFDAGFKLWMRG